MKISSLRGALALALSLAAFIAPAGAADYPSPIFKDLDIRGVVKLPGAGYPKANSGAAVTYSLTIPLADISPLAANSILGNATGSSAPPTALTTLPSGLTIPEPHITGSSTIDWTQSGAGAVTRDLSGKVREMVSVTDFFTSAQIADIATGAPTLDLQTAIQNAENSLPTVGGTLYFPPGTYRWDSTVLLSSNRQVQCSAGAVFLPLYNFSLFANDEYAAIDPATDRTAPTDANQTDRHISLEGCVFDWTGLGEDISPTPVNASDTTAAGIRFWLAQDVRVANNRFIASDPPKFNGATYYGFAAAGSCTGTRFCTFENNLEEGMHIGWDIWGGSNNIIVKNNRFLMNDNEVAHRANGYCIGINGRGTQADFHLSTEDIDVSNNYCSLQGWGSCVQFDPLSAGSYVKRIKIVDNTCVASAVTTENTGIIGRGNIEDVLIDGNTLDRMNSLPVFVTDNFSTGGPFTCTDCITTTNNSDSAVVAIPSYTAAKVVVGNYIKFSGGTGAVGGITFSGKYFLVTAVTAGVSATVQADATATSSATGGGSVSTEVWWGAPKGGRIINNRFKDSSYAGAALAHGLGENIQIGDNSAIGGTYGAVTFASSFFRGTTATPAPVVWGTSGVAGSGIAGTSGDAIDNYAASRNPQTAFPSIVIPHGTAPSATLLKDGQVWSTTTAFFARINGATKTFANLEGAQTFSAVKTFSVPPIMSSLTGPLRGNGATAVTAGPVPLSDIATQATNTLIGNATPGSAAPTALAIGSCSTSASALQWTTNTGFGCNTAIDAATLGGATFSAPGAIGGTTPGSGAFTTTTATSINKVTITAPATSATLTLADGSTLATSGAFSTTLTATAATVATLPAGTHSLAPLDSPTFTTPALGVASATSLTLASTTLLTTSVALTNGAAAQTATMTNGPTAGNPTKWIPINDNGTTRYIPAW